MTAFFFSTKARLYVQVFDNSPDYIPESGVFSWLSLQFLASEGAEGANHLVGRVGEGEAEVLVASCLHQAGQKGIDGHLVRPEFASEEHHRAAVAQAEVVVLHSILKDFRDGIITTQTLGKAFEPEQYFENPDGTPITFDRDYFGAHRGLDTLPGPFANAQDAENTLW